MKVAYFLGALNRGGAESLILDICRQHENVPYDFVCMYRHEGNMSDAFLESGAPMIQIRKKLGFLRYLWDIRKTLLRENVIIAHSQTPSNTLLLACALIGTRIQIITTMHGYNFEHASWWQRKIVCAGSDKILFVSNHQKAYYEKKWNVTHNDRWQVLYNGVDFTKIDSALPSLEFANEPQRIRLAMVGNFVSGRSQNIIVKSIHILREQGIANFDFYFIGRRDDKEAWRYDNCVQYCEENQLSNVHFLGSRGDVPSLLKSMDGFAYSTEHDTFGIAVIEAIAAGVPVIVNDWDVMMEITNQGEWATIYKTGDAAQLAEVMRQLIEHSAEYKKKAKKYPKLVRERFSIEKHIERLNEIYSSMNE